MKVDFIDLTVENKAVVKKVLHGIERLLHKPMFFEGKDTQSFERDFARFCGTKFCVGVGSGGDALLVSLLACGVGPGDEVITSAISYTATPLAIVHCGARPVFVDVDQYGNIDPHKIEAAITSKTKAILVVHMYGNSCDMDEILAISRKHKLTLIDDCAHAHGARYKNQGVGSLGDISCFSFYPTKNLGAWGNAGAITTNNQMLRDRVIMLKNFGEVRRNFSETIGYNLKLDTIQAIALREKLKYLKGWNKQRLVIAREYTRALAEIRDIQTLPFSSGISYYVFPIKTSRRDELKVFLEKKGIDCRIHYPLALHLQKCFDYLGYQKGDFPAAEAHAKQVLSLPFYPKLPSRAQKYVIRCIKEFYKSH